MQLALHDRVVIIEPPRLPGIHRMVGAWWPPALALGLGLVAAIICMFLDGLTQRPSPAPATLEVTSDPTGAEILVDGWPRGHTPARLTLPAGSHQITVREAGYLDHLAPTTLRPNQTITINVAL